MNFNIGDPVIVKGWRGQDHPATIVGVTKIKPTSHTGECGGTVWYQIDPSPAPSDPDEWFDASWLSPIPGGKQGPRAWTEEEVIAMIVDHVSTMADYWAKTDLKRPEFGIKTPEEDARYRCRGVAHSILAMLDGATMDLPGFDLIPTPHPDDKQFHIYEGENWFDPEMRISVTLHEHFSAKD